ncbi:hypothetical protein ACGC1H_003059 [Rhizoctonia solani]
MALIPGVRFVREFGTGMNNKGMTKYIVLDNSTLDGDWSRYWYYAPLVKRLKLFAPQVLDDYNLLIRGWHILFLKLREGVLLPNLCVLNIEGLRMHASFDRITWSALFLSPSLQELDINDATNVYLVDPQLPTYPLYFLLGALIEKLPCSSNASLSISYQPPSEDILASLYPNEYQQGYHWFSRIPDLSRLQELGITVFPLPETVRDALCITGCLPLLRRLRLEFMVDWDFEIGLDSEGQYDCDKLPPLHSNLFPSLRRLHLGRVPYFSLYQWIWSLSPLVSGLSSACIDRQEFGFSPEEYRVNVVRPIHENSPSLNALSVFVADLKMGALETTCEILSQIPLKELELHCMRYWGLFPATYSGSTFPHLQRFIIQAPLGIEHWPTIIQVAKALPNLEFLYIWPYIRTFALIGYVGIDQIALQKIKIEVQRPFLGDACTNEGWDEAVLSVLGFLRAIWPNALISTLGWASPTISPQKTSFGNQTDQLWNRSANNLCL